MSYTVIKTFIRRKRHPLHKVVPALIMIGAVPVIAIASVSLLFYVGFMWIRSKLPGNTFPEPEHYRFETSLVKNNSLSVTLVEDEADAELADCNENWTRDVYDEETCLYRAATVPLVPELHGKICCYYLKEETDGIILQVLDVPASSGLDTKLIYIHYSNLHVDYIDTCGPFFLYNDKTDRALIKGFNKNEHIEIRIRNKEFEV